MPIIFAAISSHSPLLLERVGKSHRQRLDATLRSYRELERQLYAAKPETLAVISPHGDAAGEAFRLGSAETYVSSFDAFGDFGSAARWRADPRTAQHLRAADESQRQPFAVRLAGETQLDHGVAVPLEFLGAHLPALRLLPVHTAAQPATVHWRFGQFVGQQLRGLERRVAVLASADLSHRLTADAPAGFSPQAAAFDRQVLELVRRGDAAALLSLDAALVAAMACCGFLPLVAILGVLDGVRSRPVVLSYEGPFGVGHLMAYFDLAEC